ncbi:hypothetical protein CBER1_05052 [Cercospora berteroae]|uniref:Uncharacterized protein n=1 Tax=Cercospora berteroae TaxID=357750 RepID=A0A2S6BRH2_9PEZI|nr:hypothetical protein CBER1_05052 [Cercospora berteroae]
MAEYLFEERMLSDEQARGLREQGYLDEEMVDPAPGRERSQTHGTAIQISIRPSQAAQPDDNDDKPQPSLSNAEPAVVSTSSVEVEPTTSLTEASSEREDVVRNVFCFSAAQDDSTMPAWSSTAFSEQQHAEVADLFALRAAVWHMTRRATDLSNPTNLQDLASETLSLPPLSLASSVPNDEVSKVISKDVPQTAIMQRRNSWSCSSGSIEPPDLQDRPSSTLPERSRQWLEEAEYIAHAQESTSGDGSRRTPGAHLRSLSSNGRTVSGSRRRAADDEDEGNADQGQDGWRKRRRLHESCQRPQARIRLPCIFNMGDPATFSKHTATYEHISELLRHLMTHDFHACQKCFTKFDSAAENQRHICKKTCRNTACRRTVLLNAAQSFACSCVTTAVEQWQQLFSLQYPSQPVPTLQPHTYDDLVTTPSLQPETPFPLNFSQNAAPAFDNNIFGLSNTNVLGQAALDTNWIPTLPPQTAVPAMKSDLGHALQREQQQLSERLSRIECRRQNTSSKREEVLETLLLSVWEAFCEVGTPKTRVDGPLWRMMRRDAPGILDQTTASIGPSSVLPSQLVQNGDVGQHFDAHHTSTNGHFVTNGDPDWLMNLTAPGDFTNASAHPNMGFGAS